MIKNNKLYCDFCQKEINRKKQKRDIEYKHHFCCKKCESKFRKGNLIHSKKQNEILLLKDYAIIKIQNRQLGVLDCIVDKEDVEVLSQYYWTLKYDKRHLNLVGYVETRSNNKRLFIHRFLMNPPSGMVIDHRNGNTLDNRKKNLKVCTQGINCKNQTKAKNIYYNKRDDLFTVSFNINGKTKYVCYTRDYKEAETYALWGRNLLIENKVDELLSTPCKCIMHSYQSQNSV